MEMENQVIELNGKFIKRNNMSKFYTGVDVHRGRICHSYYEDGKKCYDTTDFCPSLFIKSNKSSGFKTLFNEDVEYLNFGSINEYNQYKHSYKKTFDFYGDIEPKYQFISEEYSDNIEYDSKHIRTFLYDIEVINIYDDPNLNGFPRPEDAKVPVVGITIKDSKDDLFYVLSLVDYEPKNTTLKIDPAKLIFKKFKTEEQLLKAFIRLFEIKRPDVLIGWYNKGFDDSYILHRITKLLGEKELKKLSPNGVVKFNFKENKYGKIEPKVTIQGIQILDYIELYKKFIPGGREAFTLNFISKYELGEEKVEYQDFDNLKDFYIKDPQLATDYNIYDVELIDLIDNKLQLIELVFTMAYMSKVNFEDVLSPIKTWECNIYNYLKKDNIVIPPKHQFQKEKYPGAYVHDPIPGIYKWVVTEDLDSLYPHLIMQFNISTETIVDECENVDQVKVDDSILFGKLKGNPEYILSGSGQYFRKDKKGLFPILMDDLYSKRKEVKKKMILKKIEKEKATDKKEIELLTNEIARLHNIQLTFKLFLNSAYGAMASPYFRYYDIRMAKAITMSGQLAIRWVSNHLDTYLKDKFKQEDKFIYADTDSVMYSLDFVAKGIKEKDPKMIVDYIDKFTQKFIDPEIERIYLNLAEYCNANENKMRMTREKIIERFLITGKKHYAYMLWDNEGVRYNEPKMKVTGIEIVRSSTPKIIKPYLKEAIRKLMYNPEKIQDYIKEVKDEFLTFAPEDISFPRGVSNVKKYTNKATMYKKGTPIAVRAGIIYNNYIEKHGINIAPINDGEKIRFIYTTTPNVFFNSNVFGWINKIPNRDEIVKYIDYPTQFDKVFFNVIHTIAKRAGFEIVLKPQTNLDELF